MSDDLMSAQLLLEVCDWFLKARVPCQRSRSKSRVLPSSSTFVSFPSHYLSLSSSPPPLLEAAASDGGQSSEQNFCLQVCSVLEQDMNPMLSSAELTLRESWEANRDANGWTNG